MLIVACLNTIDIHYRIQLYSVIAYMLFIYFISITYPMFLFINDYN